MHLFYSKFYRKFISENRLQLSKTEKKKLNQNKEDKVEKFTLNPYTLDNFTYNMKQFLDSEKRD